MRSGSHIPLGLLLALVIACVFVSPAIDLPNSVVRGKQRLARLQALASVAVSLILSLLLRLPTPALSLDAPRLDPQLIDVTCSRRC
jgi:hypothetical protein